MLSLLLSDFIFVLDNNIEIFKHIKIYICHQKCKKKVQAEVVTVYYIRLGTVISYFYVNYKLNKNRVHVALISSN